MGISNCPPPQSSLPPLLSLSSSLRPVLSLFRLKVSLARAILDETIDPLGNGGKRMPRGKEDGGQGSLGCLCKDWGKRGPLGKQLCRMSGRPQSFSFFQFGSGSWLREGLLDQVPIDDMGSICHKRYSPSHPSLPSLSLTCSFSLLSILRAEGEGGRIPAS